MTCKLPLLALITLVGTACLDQELPRTARHGKADLPGSCEESCGDQSESGECFCDAECLDFNDCCADFDEFCEVVDDDGPCAAKDCGETCKLCAPGDVGCVETSVIKMCNAEGECTPSVPVCEGDPEPGAGCANKSCGDSCTLCPPGDPNCFETSVPKFCSPDLDCKSSFPICD